MIPARLLSIVPFLMATAAKGTRFTPPAMIDLTSFGAAPDSGQDATPAFQKAIAAARSLGRAAILHIPRGRHDFFSTHATRRRCYYSNATEENSDAKRTIAIDLAGLKGFRIEGSGAKLVMRGKMTMLAAENCENLTLSGLEFDFARPTVSEITAVEKGDRFWTGRVHPDSWFRIVDHRLQWYGEDWSAYHNLVQHYDPTTQTTWRGEDPTANATSIRKVGDGLVRFDVPPDSLEQVTVGRTYQFRDVTRDETGMWFDRCRNVSMEDVKVRAMAGFGMLFQFTEGVDLRRLTVAPSPESGRTCASAADILHFSGCRGTVRVRDSLLTAAHDDAINVHGTHLRVKALEGAKKIRVRFMHPQTWGFQAFAPGDEIEFVRKDTLLGYATAKVTQVEMTGNLHEQILTIDRPTPVGLILRSDVVENVTWTPSVEIAGCEIARVPTRSILVITRRPVRIVGNRFDRIPMPSVLISDDAQSWYESGPVSDLEIRGNTFWHCTGPAIEVDPQNAAYSGPVHRGIRVRENKFEECGLPIVSARSVQGLAIKHNRVFLKQAATPDASHLVQTKQCLETEIEENTIENVKP